MNNNDFFLATAASSVSGGKVKLLLPGETTASSKTYKILNTTGISNGTVVLCVKTSGTFVVLGAFGQGGGGGGSGTVTSVGISNGGGLKVTGSPVTSSGSITVGHSNTAVTAKPTKGLYPIAYDAYGHITGSDSAVTIPSKVSDLSNDSGFVDAAGAAAAAPVQSVNGNTGTVTISVPTKVSDLSNDSGFVDAAGAAAAAPVQSVNGNTGTVVLTAADVGALADTYTPPVTSVNGNTGAVTVREVPTVTSSDNGKVLTVVSGSWAAASAGGGGGAVDSVNGQTGTVVLTAADVGALADTYTPPVTSVNGNTGAVTVREVPTVTSSDNGKYLKVVNGAWSAESGGGGAVDSVNGQTGVVTTFLTHSMGSYFTNSWIYDNTNKRWYTYEVLLNSTNYQQGTLRTAIDITKATRDSILEKYPDCVGVESSAQVRANSSLAVYYYIYTELSDNAHDPYHYLQATFSCTIFITNSAS